LKSGCQLSKIYKEERIMGRIVHEIEVEGRKLKAAFGTGSLRSYMLSKFRPPNTRRASPVRVGLGGRTVLLEDRCDLTAKIDGLEFDL